MCRLQAVAPSRGPPRKQWRHSRHLTAGAQWCQSCTTSCSRGEDCLACVTQQARMQPRAGALQSAASAPELLGLLGSRLGTLAVAASKSCTSGPRVTQTKCS